MFQNTSLRQAERVPIIEKLAKQARPTILKTLAQTEQEVCKGKACLFEAVTNLNSNTMKL